ncbi:Exocyst complex subunit Exo70, C-terminal [Dillenia turbinata]|uniref:Exocyst subunit Exo70 family protein n=1 Tax=Dillenia turbinata TaxID=194707 RepID=A0AAN8VJV9_9MAGN
METTAPEKSSSPSPRNQNFVSSAPDSADTHIENEDVKHPDVEDEIKEAPVEHEESSSAAAGSDAGEKASDLDSVSDEIDQFLSLLSSMEDKSTPPDIPDYVEVFCKLVEMQIFTYDSGDSSARFGCNPDDDSRFLESVNRISKLTNVITKFCSANSYYAVSLNQTSSVMQCAMNFLENEFHALLEDSNSKRLKKEDSNVRALKTKQPSFSSNSYSNSTSNRESSNGLPESESDHPEEDSSPHSPEVVARLNKIATAMISGGFEAECCHVYSMIRHHAVREAMSKMGFEKMSLDDVHKMNWDHLEQEINRWCSIVKETSKLVFTTERNLIEAVFSGYPSIYQTLFKDLARSVIFKFLNFAEGVSMTKQALEKLFKVLDMFEVLRDLNLKINKASYSDDEWENELKSEICTPASRLGELAYCIFCDLEGSIKSDTGKTPVPFGGHHPMIRWIINYLRVLSDYKDSMEELFEQHQKSKERHDETAESDDHENDSKPPHAINNNNKNHRNNQNQKNKKMSGFRAQWMVIMHCVDQVAETKSKLYKDPSLRYIFLMNNGRYMLQKIKESSEMQELVGDAWMKKWSSDLRTFHKNYQRETWGRLLQCLNQEGLQVNGKVYKPALKERFKNFNAMFDEIHKTQGQWVVTDSQLQSELRVSISAVIIPAYRSFLARFSQYLDPGRQTEKYIKLQPEDIENAVEELFEGSGHLSMARKRT